MKLKLTLPLILIASALLLPLSSCKEKAATPTFITPEKTELQVGAERATHTLDIATNATAPLKLSRPLTDEWVAIWVKEGKLHMRVDQNLQRQERTTTILLQANGTEQKVTLTQASADVLLTVDKEKLEFGAQGGTATLRVKSNIPYQIVLPTDAPWLTATQEGKVITITAEPYNRNKHRSATLTIKAEGAEHQVTVGQQGEAAFLSIAIPELTEPQVLAVYEGNVQIAEICREYLNVRKDAGSRNRAETVIYPMKEGKPDLTAGIVASDGATLAWNLATNRATLTPAATPAPVVSLFYDGKQLLTQLPEGEQILPATVRTVQLEDARPGAATITYPIVKVGTQYWMAAPLKATHFQDGTPIKFITGDENWSVTEPAYCYPESQQDNVEHFGLYYNGYAVASDKQLAPKGWRIPSNTDFTTLQSYLGSKPGNRAKSRKFWQGETPDNFTNISGLNIVPSGHRAQGSNEFMIGVRAYLWSSDTGRDALTNTTGRNYVMLNAGNTGFHTPSSVNPQIHNEEAGHTVICIRK